MSALSDYLENKLLDHILRGGAAYTQPAAIYVGLFTTAPTDAGPGTEVTGGAYARQAITFTASAAGSTSNAADVTYPTATANWGTVTHFAIFDAATAGNMLIYGSLSVNKVIGVGDIFKFPAGNITATMN